MQSSSRPRVAFLFLILEHFYGHIFCSVIQEHFSLEVLLAYVWSVFFMYTVYVVLLCMFHFVWEVCSVLSCISQLLAASFSLVL